MNKSLCLLLLLALLAPLACSDGAAASNEPPVDPEPPANDGKIDLPRAVRENLGIDWSVAEMRVVSDSRYLPATVEAPVEAYQQLQSPFRGQVKLAVSRYQEVKAGDLLATVMPFDIEEHARALTESSSDRVAANTAVAKLKGQAGVLNAKKAGLERIQVKGEAQIASRREHLKALNAEIELVAKRVRELETLGKKGAGLANEIAAAKLELAAKQTALTEVREEIADAELDDASRRAEVAELKEEIKRNQDALRFAELAEEGLEDTGKAQRAAIAVAYRQPTSLLADKNSALATLRAFKGYEIKAPNDGVVSDLALSSLATVNQDATVLTLLDRNKLMIRAHQAQARVIDDLSRYSASAQLPSGEGKAIEGTLTTALEAEGDQRLSDVIFRPTNAPQWLRPGLAMRLEIVRKDAQQEVLAIEASAVIKDGLTMVYFKRDPTNPNKVMRLEADLGISDGRWIEIKSGLSVGDQVVRKGVYELKLASSSQASKGGHFHADGTFHEEGH